MAAVTSIVSDIYMFQAAVHSSADKTLWQLASPSVLPLWLVATSAYQTVASIMHNTAMEQLQGSRPLGDWQPVIEVSTANVKTCLCGQARK